MKENDGFKCARFNRFVKELGADKDSPREKGKSFGAHLSNLKELERSALRVIARSVSDANLPRKDASQRR
jgi:hypothetical protein